MFYLLITARYTVLLKFILL